MAIVNIELIHDCFLNLQGNNKNKTKEMLETTCESIRMYCKKSKEDKNLNKSPVKLIAGAYLPPKDFPKQWVNCVTNATTDITHPLPPGEANKESKPTNLSIQLKQIVKQINCQIKT